MVEEKLMVGYARISSALQGEESLELQAERLKAAGVDEVLKDIRSGRHTDRKEYQRLMRLVKSGKVAKVIVTRLDRLGRTQQGLIATLAEFDKWGVELVALDQPTEKGSYGKFLRGLFGLLAELEVEQLSERIKRNLEQSRTEGRAMRPPFGYVTENGKYIFDKNPKFSFCLLDSKPENPNQVLPGMSAYDLAQDLIDIFFECRSLRVTLKIFNDKYPVEHYRGEGKLGFCHSGFCLWLDNPVLRGNTAYLKLDYDKGNRRKRKDDWQIVEGTHTNVLLTPSYTAKIVEILRDNRKKFKFTATKKKHLFTGLVTCAACGSNCNYYSTHKH